MTATRRRERGLDVNLRSGPQMREYAAIVKRITADRPGRLLDWGCGWGQVTTMLRAEGIDVTAFDYRPGLTRDGFHALERYPDIEAYLTGEPRELPFDDGSFDSVLSCGVLEHVVDPAASLDEIGRVLRPGGTFYVFKLPNRFSYLERIARLAGLYYHGASAHDRIYGRRDALALIRDHGFEVTEFRRANMLPLTVGGRVGPKATSAVWGLNRALGRIPGLNLLATNLEVVARRPVAS